MMTKWTALMRKSTERRVDELVELSRAAVSLMYGSQVDSEAALVSIVLRLTETLAGLDRATRIAACVCLLEANLEMYADEVDSGKSSATPRE